ncbi:protein spaetzle 3 [Lepeophtheirus salmonis]|uniref:protein spaetzle 3 n=1 Tax=Lepeophtheirus salmonis TaxID=72036 RepID=UPI001AE827EF|nr:protein spaetzle 3-like [Lepeophtheirus salmonis]XP_040578161.1 protein spaetzle 3-like [Lepeophtheirus salmonis]
MRTYISFGALSRIVLIISNITLIQSLSNEGTTSINNEMPCVKRLNQLYCNGAGSAYPLGRISTFIDEHKALIKRMFGDMQETEPKLTKQTSLKTPASTIYFRSSTSFKSTRFSRSILEGFIEDFDVLKKTNKTRTRRETSFPGITLKDDPNKVDSCESSIEISQPYWAENSNNQIRAIVNTKQFNQAIHQEICSKSRTVRCAGDCSCEQKYKWHRLLSYDPNNDCSGIFMDWFLFPSCCSCRCLKNPTF